MSLNVQKQIDYWQGGALEDIDVARTLISLQKFRHGMFLAHLALEKMLKAHVAKTTQQIPPKIHNLLRLGDIAMLNLDVQKRDFLTRFDRYQQMGRYPETWTGLPNAETMTTQFLQAEQFLQWLKTRL